MKLLTLSMLLLSVVACPKPGQRIDRNPEPRRDCATDSDCMLTSHLAPPRDHSDCCSPCSFPTRALHRESAGEINRAWARCSENACEGLPPAPCAPPVLVAPYCTDSRVCATRPIGGHPNSTDTAMTVPDAALAKDSASSLVPDSLDAGSVAGVDAGSPVRSTKQPVPLRSPPLGDRACRRDADCVASRILVEVRSDVDCWCPGCAWYGLNQAAARRNEAAYRRACAPCPPAPCVPPAPGATRCVDSLCGGP